MDYKFYDYETGNEIDLIGNLEVVPNKDDAIVMREFISDKILLYYVMGRRIEAQNSKCTVKLYLEYLEQVEE